MLLKVITITILLFGLVVLLLWASLQNNKEKGMTHHSCGVSEDGTGGGCSMCGISEIKNDKKPVVKKFKPQTFGQTE